MSDAAIASVQPLPWESGTATGESEAAETLLDLASDDEVEEITGEGGSDSEGDEPEEIAEPEEVADEAEESGDELEDGEEPEEPEEPTFTVTVDGEEVEVTQTELLAGYSRTADYTRKTQALANERKAVLAEQQQIRAVREQEAQRLAQVEEALQSLMPAEPDWAALRQQDPAEFAAQWAEHQQRQQEIAYVQQQRQIREQEVAIARNSELARVLEEEKAKLVEAIPAWKEPAKAAEGKKKLAEYAKSLGYTEQDLAQVYDHRLMVILNKAAAYDAIQTGKAKVVSKQVAPEHKVLKPGSRNASTRSTKNGARAIQRLDRSGRAVDAAAAILALDL